MILSFNTSTFRRELEKELTQNILPFWMEHVIDKLNGGFYGALTNELKILNDVPRASTLGSRILWTYSKAYGHYQNEQYFLIAQQIYKYLTEVFWDHDYGGVYWDVDLTGKAVNDRKHHYAQAFAIYGLSQYYRETREPQSLELAKKTFSLLEKHAFDSINGGYIEGCTREWKSLEDMRLSAKDLNSRKSLNTTLHILEAYTNLMRVWDDEELQSQHKILIGTFLQNMFDGETGHLKLFFDDQWNSLSDLVSYGHEIEASWLLLEAAEMHNDEALLNAVREACVKISETVLREAVDEDGGIFYETDPTGYRDDSKEWWVQTEAIIGFYNAYRISGEVQFADAAHRCWTFIQNNMIDHQHGDWFKRLKRDGTPIHERYKAGPWDCPYHHSRLCFEMMKRLGED